MNLNNLTAKDLRKIEKTAERARHDAEAVLSTIAALRAAREALRTAERSFARARAKAMRSALRLDNLLCRTVPAPSESLDA